MIFHSTHVCMPEKTEVKVDGGTIDLKWEVDNHRVFVSLYAAAAKDIVADLTKAITELEAQPSGE